MRTLLVVDNSQQASAIKSSEDLLVWEYLHPKSGWRYSQIIISRPPSTQAEFEWVQHLALGLPPDCKDNVVYL